MFKFTRLKEDFLSSAQSLNTELWERLRNSADMRDRKKAGIVQSFIERAEKVTNEINLLFNDIQIEFGQNPEKLSLMEEVSVIFKDGRPTKINIFGEEIVIRKLNEIPVSVANWLMDHGKTLVEIPNFIHRNRTDFKMTSATPKQLKNGWFIEVGDDKDRLLDKANRLLKRAGFSRDIKVKEE